jgi:hypothetical protein
VGDGVEYYYSRIRRFETWFLLFLSEAPENDLTSTETELILIDRNFNSKLFQFGAHS